eukprot:1156700-Pelagomonas_calceolata.AAC.9
MMFKFWLSYKGRETLSKRISIVAPPPPLLSYLTLFAYGHERVLKFVRTYLFYIVHWMACVIYFIGRAGNYGEDTWVSKPTAALLLMNSSFKAHQHLNCFRIPGSSAIARFTSRQP